MGNLDHARALRQLPDQCAGRGTIGKVKIRVPLVEQIDLAIRLRDDFLEYAQLALARGVALLLFDFFRHTDLAGVLGVGIRIQRRIGR